MFQSRNYWAENIQEEWRILERDLPGMLETVILFDKVKKLSFIYLLVTDTIIVRAYKSRMDPLRAVIIGPEGTPYHRGLFFFDVYFPRTYPIFPPVCHSLHLILYI